MWRQGSLGSSSRSRRCARCAHRLWGASARSATKSQEQVCFFRVKLPDVASKNCLFASGECPWYAQLFFECPWYAQLFFPNQCSTAVQQWPCISWRPARRPTPLRRQRWPHAKRGRWRKAKPSASKFQSMVCTLTYCKRPLVQYVWFPGLGKGPLSKATPIKEKYYVKKSYVIFFWGNMFLPSSQNPYLYFSWVKMIDAYQTGNMFFPSWGPCSTTVFFGFNHRGLPQKMLPIGCEN